MSVDEDLSPSQFWGEHLVDEGLFCLPLNDCVQADHRLGLPPRTFFSHSSERLYCSRHSESCAASKRRKEDSLPLRSVTTTSCGSKRSSRETDRGAKTTRTCWETLHP